MLKKIIISALVLTNITVHANGNKKEWFAAAYQGNLDAIKKLIPTIDVNIQNDMGKTALMIAVLKDHVDVVKYLFETPNIDVNLQDPEGWTALILAVIKGDETMVKLLLTVPTINVNAQTTEGFTALMEAASRSRKNIVKILLQSPNINLNIQSKTGMFLHWRGYSALMLAVKQNDETVVKFLLDAGADINLKNADDETAYDLANKKIQDIFDIFINNKYSRLIAGLSAELNILSKL